MEVCAMADVRYEEASRIYPGSDIAAVDRLDLEIEDGEFLVLVGPSGSGKSTALRMLAGLEPVDSGGIWIGERDVTYDPPKRRDVAMVFQNYALYPYLTVAANIAFPLKMARVRKAERERRVREVAELLELTPLLERKPAQLSGGQRQRVAMGRAIIRRPSVYLMDEPLSNLDAKLRVQMRADIATLQASLATTTVYVTHDQSEAMTLGHRVAVLRDGLLQQCDTPRRLYDRPQNTFVAGFIGSPAMNLCSTEPGDNGSVALGPLQVPLPPDGRTGRPVVLGLRPESLDLAAAGIPAKVEAVEELGADAYIFCAAELAAGETRLVARCDGRQPPAPGEKVSLQPRPGEAHFFDVETGERLGS
jgi:multiple sugar transport system ATP-binding protein